MTTGPQSNLSAPAGYGSSDLVFNDNFSGTTLDSNWHPYLASNGSSGGPWNSIGSGDSSEGGLYMAQYDVPSQVSVNNGLTLTTTHQSIVGKNGDASQTYPYTSGAVSSYGAFEFTGGYLQISMQQPSGDGSWPALWLVPGQGAGNAGIVGDNFEIDMQEGNYTSGSSNPNNNLAWHLHTPAGVFGGVATLSTNLSSGFNTYAIDWEPGKSITWYLNGQQVAQVTSAQAPIPDEPMEVIMDNAVGNSASSGFRTIADGSTPSVMPMQVGDVQLYQKPGSGDTVLGANVTASSGGTSSSGTTTGTGSGSTSSGSTSSGSSASGGTSSGGTTTGTGTGSTSSGSTSSGSSASGGTSSGGTTTGTGTGGTSSGSTSSGTGGTSSGTSSSGSTSSGGTAGSGSVTDSTGGAGSTGTGPGSAGSGSSSSGSTGTGTGTGTGAGSSGAVTPPVAPVLTVADHALSVGAGKSVALGLGVSIPKAGDNVTVNIKGLPSYETITDSLDHKTFSGSNVTLTAAEANSGVTLNSNYHGRGQPSATLTVTATDHTGTPMTSAAQSILVKDPVSSPVPGTPGSVSSGSSGSVASLHDGRPVRSGSVHQVDVSQWFDHHPGFASALNTLSDAVASRRGATSSTASSVEPTAGTSQRAFALLSQMMAGDFGNASHFAQTGPVTAQPRQQAVNLLTRPLR